MSNDSKDPFASSEAQDDYQQPKDSAQDNVLSDHDLASPSSQAHDQDINHGFDDLFQLDSSAQSVSEASDEPLVHNDLKSIINDVAAFKAELAHMKWLGKISDEEINALLARFPFLQITQVEASEQDVVEACFIEAPNGWTITDYHVGMSSSPGKYFLFTDMAEEDDGEGGKSRDGGGGVPKGSGTVIKQAFDTAAFMVALAHERGWLAFHVVDGHPSMTWAAWVAAQEYGIDVLNYEPSAEDKKRLERLRRDSGTLQKLRLNINRR